MNLIPPAGTRHKVTAANSIIMELVRLLMFLVVLGHAQLLVMGVAPHKKPTAKPTSKPTAKPTTSSHPPPYAHGMMHPPGSPSPPPPGACARAYAVVK